MALVTVYGRDNTVLKRFSYKLLNIVIKFGTLVELGSMLLFGEKNTTLRKYLHHNFDFLLSIMAKGIKNFSTS